MDVVFHSTGLFGTQSASVYKDLFGIPVFITAGIRGVTVAPIDMSKTIRAVGVARATEARKSVGAVMGLIAADMAAIGLKTPNKVISNMARSMKKKSKSTFGQAYACVILKLLGVDGHDNCGDFMTVVHNSTNMLSEEF